MPKRFKCTLEYDGTTFNGWQKQPNVPSIQQSIEEAITELTGETQDVHCAGRTDAGVHATGQCIHFDLNKDWNGFKTLNAINAKLWPKPIALVDISEVDDSFHARFSATKRHYRYHIINRRPHLTLDQNRAWVVRPELDFTAMQRASRHFVGNNDFSSFRSNECQAKSPIKTVDRVDLRQEGSHIYIEVSARSFLHHMVRNITGTLVYVGLGKLEPDSIPHIINQKDRAHAGPTAPAGGLVFTKVDYD